MMRMMTLTHSVSTCTGPIYESNRSVSKLFVSKLFVLRIVT